MNTLSSQGGHSVLVKMQLRINGNCLRISPCPLPIVAERLRTLARHASVWNTAPISNSSRRDDGGTHTASYATALPSNPNGILAHSPRLAPQRLPWVIIQRSLSTPTGLRPSAAAPVCQRQRCASTPAQANGLGLVTHPTQALKWAIKTMSPSDARPCVHLLLLTKHLLNRISAGNKRVALAHANSRSQMSTKS